MVADQNSQTLSICISTASQRRINSIDIIHYFPQLQCVNFGPLKCSWLQGARPVGVGVVQTRPDGPGRHQGVQVVGPYLA